jgi:quinol monooxygenase YgiN
MIDVIVALQIKPGMETAAEEILRQLESETTENDRGCLRYQWYRAEHAGTYYLLEPWFDQAALDENFKATHMARLVPQIAERAVEFKTIRAHAASSNASGASTLPRLSKFAPTVGLGSP